MLNFYAHGVHIIFDIGGRKSIRIHMWDFLIIPVESRQQKLMLDNEARTILLWEKWEPRLSRHGSINIALPSLKQELGN